MSLPWILACLWVLAAALVALLPMRLQLWPGLALILGAVAILVLIGQAHGAGMALVALIAVLSVFRRPLFHLVNRKGRVE
ncbi:DUF2484 family protein [Pseudooceanicola nanhaiensis]|uniref:DUF2484 family protein n=1 Tax=Pseudooceanicola nanhaiensis TaxID=375761 RepID=UPI001CD1C346|nr:DUF2484 family protein [Pseudooceanicola nanhaiensis]MCA0921125.1 DUF2484 family protein [Pseudooceanicola nanhaiensis]